MQTLNAIKTRVRWLYETHPRIHMDVMIPGSKLRLKNHPVTITAVYPNIFLVEDRDGNAQETHVVQYVELMTGQVRITELPGDRVLP